MPRLSTCLWFADQAEQAARFYCATLPGARLGEVVRTPEGGVLLVAFEIGGQPLLALNGNPGEAFTAAVSLVATCAGQAELDRVWDALLEGGRPQACGWLRDRFGMAWQVVPDCLPRLMAGADAARRARVMAALMRMVKIDAAALEAA